MANYSLKSPRLSIRLVVALLLSICLLYYTISNLYSLRNTLSYATRPLWDSDNSSPHNYLTQLYADGLPPDDEAACSRHGWNRRTATPKVIDATIFSTEIELMEIRLIELWEVVDQFVVLESGHTFTGKEKNLTFAQNRARFAPYESKLSYASIPGRSLLPGEDEFKIEAEMRTEVKSHIKHVVKPPAGSLILESDVDEIPAKHTIALLKACQSPLPLHLQLRNYVYSFEFPTDMRSWRAQVHEWRLDGTTPYQHGPASPYVLTDSGWHCSFCFPRISDFAFKMKSYSHSDRLFGNANWKSFLDPARIQKLICEGKDLFEMLPEVYTWSELLGRWSGAQRTASAVYLPRAVVANPMRYKYLLPGGCIRDS